MAELLKNLYNENFVEDLSKIIRSHYSSFDSKSFKEKIFDKTWKEKELKQRMNHIAFVLQKYLPQDYKKALAIVVNCSKTIGKNQNEGMNFAYMIFPDFVEQFGLHHFDISIQALEEITKVTSAEFAVRPFLIKYPSAMQKQMLAWSSHKHPMVRRLASEGFRPRLPWGMSVPYLKKEPQLILPVLENLKFDENEIVRRSVANNLNDISKDFPELVIKTIFAWKGNNPDTDRLIKHASRTLLKKGDKNALKLFGIKADPSIELISINLKKSKIKIGDSLYFDFGLKLTKKTKLRVEYAIYYVKSSGKRTKKVFKITEGVFLPNTYSFSKKQAFTDFTTRKHYPGEHTLSIIVNGEELNIIPFNVIK